MTTIEDFLKAYPIDIDSKELFGNEAGEDEEESIFKSYAVNRSELDNLLSEKSGLEIIRAYKGEGKSALLRLITLRLKKKTKPPVVISLSAHTISPSITTANPDEWIREWKKKILNYAAIEIGRNIQFAFTDDAIALVEEAEQEGFKERNFVSSIVDRLQSSAIPIEKKREGVRNPEKILSRWLKDGDNVWFIIDDTDLNFTNVPLQKVKIATFFNALRSINTLIPAFKFRTVIRPNVWSIIKRENESLSHVEQYIHDLDWSYEDFEKLISKRIEGYLKRNRRIDEFNKINHKISRERSLIGLVFEDPMDWGNDTKRPTTTVLYTLARQRPRWLVELWRVSAKAISKKSNKITLGTIKDQLKSFGQRRIDDTVAEFKSQCPKVEDLIVAFTNEKELLKLDELIDLINRKVVVSKINIVGVSGAPSAWEIANFLYQIGFISGREDFTDGSYEHISFIENPRLILEKKDNVSWEIHPVFRQALALKNA